MCLFYNTSFIELNIPSKVGLFLMSGGSASLSHTVIDRKLNPGGGLEFHDYPFLYLSYLLHLQIQRGRGKSPLSPSSN